MFQFLIGKVQHIVNKSVCDAVNIMFQFLIGKVQQCMIRWRQESQEPHGVSIPHR